MSETPDVESVPVGNLRRAMDARGAIRKSETPKTKPMLSLDVDMTGVDPEATITIPLWRWHILTCYSMRYKALVEAAQQQPDDQDRP